MTKRRSSFTLVELLVAVGLLSLIVMLLLQLFSGAQKIWLSSEKTNNVYSDARVAMERMAQLFNTIQFSHGEKEVTVNGETVIQREKKKDMIFSINTANKDGNYYSNSIVFVSKSPIRTAANRHRNTTNFISFRLGANSDENKRGKLYMVIYSYLEHESTFNDFFPNYGTSERDLKLTDLKNELNALYENGSENAYCQVIAENVVEFKINAYVLNSSDKLEKKAESADVAEPPYMIEIQLTVLDPDSYKRWQELSGDAKTKYLEQHRRTFTRSVRIGGRWALEAQSATTSTP